jgi:hypothetical protein
LKGLAVFKTGGYLVIRVGGNSGYIEKEADRYVWVRITDTGKQYVESGSRRL